MIDRGVEENAEWRACGEAQWLSAFGFSTPKIGLNPMNVTPKTRRKSQRVATGMVTEDFSSHFPKVGKVFMNMADFPEKNHGGWLRNPNHQLIGGLFHDL